MDAYLGSMLPGCLDQLEFMVIHSGIYAKIDRTPSSTQTIRCSELIEDSPAVVIGVGGGRGAAKSSGIDRIAITLMTERPTLCCMVMRTWPQLLTFHLEQCGVTSIG